MSKTAKQRRICLLDEVRGFCVFSMIVYHALAFLGHQYGLSFGTKFYTLTSPLEPWCAGVFILICGMCCHLSHSNFKRGIILAFIAAAISVATIVFLPKIGVNVPVWFGILHLLSTGILLYALFSRTLGKLSPMAGIIIFAILFLLFRNIVSGTIGLGGVLEWHIPEAWHQNPYLFPLGIISKDFFSTDYFPVFPYVFLFLTGTYMGAYFSERTLPEYTYKKRIPALDWLGTHALLIYVLHIPATYLIAECVLRIIRRK